MFPGLSGAASSSRLADGTSKSRFVPELAVTENVVTPQPSSRETRICEHSEVLPIGRSIVHNRTVLWFGTARHTIIHVTATVVAAPRIAMHAT